MKRLPRLPRLANDYITFCQRITKCWVSREEVPYDLTFLSSGTLTIISNTKNNKQSNNIVQ